MVLALEQRLTDGAEAGGGAELPEEAGEGEPGEGEPGEGEPAAEGE